MSRTKLFLTGLLVAATQLSVVCATTYHYVAAGGDLSLISADGKTKLVLNKEGQNTSWGACTVSPSGTIVAQQFLAGADAEDQGTNLYAVDPKTGMLRLITSGRIWNSVTWVWVSDDTLLVERLDVEGDDLGVYAINVKSSQMKQVVAPTYSAVCYDELCLSPSKKLLTTSWDVPTAECISIHDTASGKQYWRTNPKRGLSGLSGSAWSSDSKSLFVSFYVDKELYLDSQGGIQKIDAFTGKQTKWKYDKENIDGIWSDPVRKLLVVDRKKNLEVLRMSDGKLLHKLPGICGPVLFPGGGRTLVIGGNKIVEFGASWKVIKMYDRTSDIHVWKYSPDHNAVMHMAYGQGPSPNGTWLVLDLSTGKTTKVTNDPADTDWLKHDVVR